MVKIPFTKEKTETKEEIKRKIASIPVENFPTIDPKIARRYPDPLLPVLMQHKAGSILITPIEEELNAEELMYQGDKLVNLVTPAILQIDRKIFRLPRWKQFLIPKHITLRGHTNYFGEPFMRDNFTTAIVNQKAKYEFLVEREILRIAEPEENSPTGYIATDTYENRVLKETGEPLRNIYDVSDSEYMRAQQGAMNENDTFVDFAMALRQDPEGKLQKSIMWIVIGAFSSFIILTLLMLQSFTGGLY
ncbi:MAG: hypothetical protein ACW990_00190 [Promethearchaeota archaeon]